MRAFRIAVVILLLLVLFGAGVLTLAPTVVQSEKELDDLDKAVQQLHDAGKFVEAVSVAERYVASARKEHGEEHPVFATALSRLISVQLELGRSDEAEPSARRALAIREKTMGSEHPQTASSLLQLAEVLSLQGKQAEAAPLEQRAVAIREKVLGPKHPDTAQALHYLGGSYMVLGRLADAEPLLERALAVREEVLGPEHRDVVAVLSDLATVYAKQGRNVEAEPLYRRALEIDQKSFGPEHPDVATSLNNLAQLLKATNRLAEAEPLMHRALAISEKSLGPNHPTVAIRLNNLAELLRATNRPVEAEPLYRRALAISEKRHGPEHPDVAVGLNNLAFLLRTTNRPNEAEPLYRRALAIFENSYGVDHPNVATGLNNLAQLLQATNRFGEAEPLMRRALAIDEKSYGPEHPEVATDLSNLAELLRVTNRLVEAEPLYRRALAIDEKSHGPEHPNIAIRLNNLAGLLQTSDRHGEAELLYRRALAIDEKSYGSEHPNVGRELNNLAYLLRATNRLAEAEPLHRRALAIFEKSYGPDHPDVAVGLNNLAVLLQTSNRHGEAEPLYRRALAIGERSQGPEHPNVAIRLNNLALLLQATNRLTEAEPLVRRALAIDEKSYGPDHPEVATDLNNLAGLLALRGDWAGAVVLHRREKPIRTGRGEAKPGDRGGLAKAALTQSTWALRGFAQALHRVGTEVAEAREEGLEVAQWALQTSAAEALAQMTARLARGVGDLSIRARQRQDLIVRRRGEMRRLDAAAGSADIQEAEKARTAVATIDKELDALDAQLAAEFPDYADLATPKPLTTAAIQTLLKDDEALVMFLDVPQLGKLPGESLIWTVTKTDVRWFRIDLGTKALAEHVAALRCGLDNELWEDADKADRCVETLKRHRFDAKVDGYALQVLPFDLGRAHELYKALMGPFEDMIQGKHLLIVPSGPLTSLPFQVLVTEPPQTAIPRQPEGATDGAWLRPYRDAAWLGVRQPITVLPSVSSLKALRAHAKASRASRPYLGVGNPLLDGKDPLAADAARARQRCPVPASQLVVASRGRRSPAGFGKLFRGTQADVEQVRAEAPLPESAEELCAIASRLGVPASEILLGSNATETELKALSEQGRLAEHRIVHFATHGALAGQVKGFAEPGLILTPPPKDITDRKALEHDDGYLAASEVATLKLDADWVVLSACNTAGGQGENAEALSGLARAFFYAGARALLVSHWAVGSDAAVKLTTGAFEAQKADAGVGRAEALRLSMRSLIHNGSAIDAHPMVWAPFVVVGEGAGDAGK